MFKISLILFVACAVISSSMCYAQKTAVGRLSIKIHKLNRKTDFLQQEVDDIWATVLTPDIGGQDYDNKTRTDDPGTDKCRDFERKVNETVTTVKDLKSEVDNLIFVSRNGFRNEKHWQRETARNLSQTIHRNITGMLEEFQTDVTAEKQKVTHHLESIDIELLRIDESCNVKVETINTQLVRINESCNTKVETCNVKLETMNTELKERKSEAVNEREHMRTIIDDLRTNQNKLESENHALRQTILEIQNDYETIKTETQPLSQTILELQREVTKLQSTCKPKVPTTPPPAATTTTPTAPTISTTTTTIPFLATCDEGWRHFKGHCYLVVEEDKTWDDASAYCKNINSYLVEITTDAEREFVHELTRDYGIIIWFWTGATDRAKEGLFVYHHSQQLVPGKYWYEGQPNNSEDYHCVCMSRYYGDLELFDNRCSFWGYFVCEKHKHRLQQ